MRGMAVDLWSGVIQGFCTGEGVGLANWVFVKRLEVLEQKILKAKNGKQTIEGEKQ